jgi:hypothetical protein
MKHPLGGTRRAAVFAASAVLALALALPAGAAATAAGTNGRIFYQGPQSGTDGPADIFSVAPLGGEPLDLTKENGFSEERPSASGNGRVVFMSFRDEGWNIFLMNADGTGIVDLTKTKSPIVNFEPAISPDGSEVVYMHQDPSGQDLWRVGADGSNPEDLTEAVGEETSAEFSADGSRIAYVGTGPNGSAAYNNDIWVMNADGSDQTQLTETDFPQQNLSPTWSPDGTKIAYTTSEGGSENGFHVMNANGSGDSGPLPSGSPIAASELSWSPDGTKIAYRPAGGGLWMMNPDGTGGTPLVGNTGVAYFSWAPAGPAGSGGGGAGGGGASGSGTPPPPSPGPPSNKFSFGKVKLNKKKGTASLTVTVPAPGVLTIKGKGLKKATKTVTAPGKAVLPVKASGKALEKLNANGAVGLKAKVTFAPTGGSPRTEPKSLTLKKQP